MRVAVAIDSFKGSLSTFEAGEAVSCGIKKVYPDATVDVRPLADGGEGTVEALIAALGGERRKISVTGPLGRMVTAEYGFLPERKTAVMEMASASGITLLEESERNPMLTTTYGVGEMIVDAIQNGCRKFIVGIGGSATNDGGIGMLQALGFSFLDENNVQVPFGANGLKVLKQIKTDNVLPALKECTFMVACDVKNPLCGVNGCSHVFAKQKGGTPQMILEMDEWMERYAQLTKSVLPQSDATAQGAGAAGGLGFAFLSYLPSVMQPGIELVIKETDLESYVKNADIVVTGEGRLDSQSVMGKAPVGVASLAKKYGKPVFAFSGCVTKEADVCNEHGIDAYFPILATPCSLEEAMNKTNAFDNLSRTAQQAFRIVKALKG